MLASWVLLIVVLVSFFVAINPNIFKTRNGTKEIKVSDTFLAPNTGRPLWASTSRLINLHLGFAALVIIEAGSEKKNVPRIKD